MRLVRPAPEAASAAGDRITHAGTRTRWLVLSCYLLAAVALTARLWADPAGRVQAGDPHDVDLFAWFVRYSATAVSRGRLPALVTTALNAPQGISVMWNTSLLLPGVLLAPVTLLAGPQASLTVVLTLSYAGSAAAMFLVLRRWGASVAAAALGGAVYGFSPALLNSGLGHYQLAFAVLPPLMIDALLRIVTGRGSAVRAGAWLGLLAAAQLFIGEELLVDTVLAGALLVAVLAAQRPRAAARRARGTAAGLATAAAVIALTCGHALWEQISGPLRERSVLLSSWSGDLSSLVVPPGQLLMHTPASAARAASFQPGGPSEYLGHLGWPLLALLLAAAVRYWQDPKVRAAAVTWVMLELCSLGGGTLVIGTFRYPGDLLPWHWLQGLPGLAQVIPDRFAILADGAAAALLAFALDRARSAAPQARRWRRHAPAAVTVLALSPLIPTPIPASPLTPVPAGWQAAFSRLRLTPDARVLVVPIPILRCTVAMRWQADTGVPGSLIGGYFLGPDQTGQAAFSPGPTTVAARYLDQLWQGGSASGSSFTPQLRSDLAYWRPAAIVAVTGPGSPLEHVLAGLVGSPTFRVARVLVWRL
jgi:hypothetical protein